MHPQPLYFPNWSSLMLFQISFRLGLSQWKHAQRIMMPCWDFIFFFELAMLFWTHHTLIDTPITTVCVIFWIIVSNAPSEYCVSLFVLLKPSVTVTVKLVRLQDCQSGHDALMHVLSDYKWKWLNWIQAAYSLEQTAKSWLCLHARESFMQFMQEKNITDIQ